MPFQTPVRAEPAIPIPRSQDRTSPRREPVFLLSPPRSYSTVTLALLAGHPDLYGFPEMVLFKADTVGGLLDTVMPWQRTGILRAVAELREASQDDAAIHRASQWLTQRRSWSPQQLMDHLLALVHPRIGLEKSPETVGSSVILKTCMNRYPNARYIHLTRHPATTMRSIQNAGRAYRWSGDGLVAASASAWYLGHARVVLELAQLPPQQWIRVHAEDVLRDPGTWVPRVLDWLGLRSDADVIGSMLRTEDWRFAGTGPSGNLFGGCPDFMRSPALRTVPEAGEIAFDPSWCLPAELGRRLTALARYLGYREGQDPGPALPEAALRDLLAGDVTPRGWDQLTHGMRTGP